MIKQLDQKFKQVCHAALISLANRRKNKTNLFLTTNNQLKKNSKTIASESNAISIKPRTSNKKLNSNQKNKEKKLKIPLTNKSTEFGLKISKKALYTKIKSLKKMLKKLILN